MELQVINVDKNATSVVWRNDAY